MQWASGEAVCQSKRPFCCKTRAGKAARHSKRPFYREREKIVQWASGEPACQIQRPF